VDWNKAKQYKRKDLLDEIQALECEASYYEQSLENALKLMVKVASGRQTAAGMGRWVSLNYREYRPKLPKRLRITRP
jgi:hypothetical protein